MKQNSYAQFLEYYKTSIEQNDRKINQLMSLKNASRKHYNTTLIDESIEEELFEIDQYETHLSDKIPLFLSCEIQDAAIKTIKWLCASNVVNGDQGWGRAVGRESRVANTVEACMALVRWQQLLSDNSDQVEVLQGIASRVPAALQWAAKHQDVSGGFIGLSHGTVSVHNTAMLVWLVCTAPTHQIQDTPVDWNAVISKALEWFQHSRSPIRGYDFFGDVSSATRVFSSIWALRALISFSASSFSQLNTDWNSITLGKEITSFLKTVKMGARDSSKSEYLVGYTVTETRSSPAIVALLLTMLSEARMAGISLDNNEVDKFISKGIEYLFETVGNPFPDLWDDETEGYSQYLPKQNKTTTRSWSHVATPWCLQALFLNKEYLNQHQRLIVAKTIIALISQQTDEGYFLLLRDIDPGVSIFGTALQLYALASAIKFVESLVKREKMK